MRRESQCERKAAGRPAVVLRVDGPLTDLDVDRLCGQLQVAMRPSDVTQVTCEIGSGVDADARLQLTARQLGGEIRLSRASSAVLELLVFAGLGDIVRPVCG